MSTKGKTIDADHRLGIHGPGGAFDEAQNNGVRPVLAEKRVWLLWGIFFGVYGTPVTFQGLWATPFIMEAFGVEQLVASRLNMVIPVGTSSARPCSAISGTGFPQTNPAPCP